MKGTMSRDKAYTLLEQWGLLPLVGPSQDETTVVFHGDEHISYVVFPTDMLLSIARSGLDLRHIRALLSDCPLAA